MPYPCSQFCADIKFDNRFDIKLGDSFHVNHTVHFGSKLRSYGKVQHGSYSKVWNQIWYQIWYQCLFFSFLLLVDQKKCNNLQLVMHFLLSIGLFGIRAMVHANQKVNSCYLYFWNMQKRFWRAGKVLEMQERLWKCRKCFKMQERF